MASSRTPGGTPRKRVPRTSRRADAVPETLTLIRTSFPGCDELIATAFHDSRSFRELCEDYRRCVAALHRWQRLEPSSTRSRGQEYSELLAELGGEIQIWLEALDTDQTRRGGNGP